MLKIGNWRMWDRVRKGLQTRGEGRDIPSVADEIVPVVVVAEVQELIAEMQFEFVAGATGWFVLFTVPEGEKWKVTYLAARRVTGTSLYKVSFVVGGAVYPVMPIVSGDVVIVYPRVILGPGAQIEGNLVSGTAGNFQAWMAIEKTFD